jgi:hypothetical protein
MKTALMRTALVTAAILLITGTAQADQNQFTAGLKHKHHTQVMTLITRFLTHQDKHLQYETVSEITRLELNMAPFVKKADAFYLNRITVTDIEQVPGQILMRYLSDRGSSMETRSFFQGKTFTCYQ